MNMEDARMNMEEGREYGREEKGAKHGKGGWKKERKFCHSASTLPVKEATPRNTLGSNSPE